MSEEATKIVSEHVLEIITLLMRQLKSHCLDLVDELPAICGDNVDKKDVILNVPFMVCGYTMKKYLEKTVRESMITSEKVSEGLDTFFEAIKKSILDEE